MADPEKEGKVDLKVFCHMFESDALRAIRLN